MDSNTKYVLLGVGVIALGWGLFGMYPWGSSYMHMDNDHHEDEMMEHFEIAPGRVAEMMHDEEDFILLDVRTPEEYEEGHLEGSMLLPVENLSAETLAEIGLADEAKDKEIILYCRSGARSRMAYDVMHALGYTNVRSIAGGMIHWQEDNYPYVEMGSYEGMMHSFDGNESAVDQSGPTINFDRLVHDFGAIPQSDGVVQTTFTVSNVGNETLEIGELSTSCGCTSAEISSKILAPNETAVLTVYFDPDFHDEPQGQITRTVFIPTNDPANQEAEVKIQVDILENQ